MPFEILCGKCGFKLYGTPVGRSGVSSVKSPRELGILDRMVPRCPNCKIRLDLKKFELEIKPYNSVNDSLKA